MWPLRCRVRVQDVTPHVAQKVRGSAIDGRTTRHDKLLGPLRGTARIKLEIQTGQRVLLLCHAEPLILAGPWDKDRLALV